MMKQSPPLVVNSPTASSMSVLLVEDDCFQLMALRGLCNSIGYKVESASSGEEVVARLASCDASAPPPWDLVICS